MKIIRDKKLYIALIPLVFPLLLRGESVFFTMTPFDWGMNHTTIVMSLMLLLMLFTSSGKISKNLKYYVTCVLLYLLVSFFIFGANSSFNKEFFYVRIYEFVLPILLAFLCVKKINVRNYEVVEKFLKLFSIALFAYIVLACIWWFLVLRFVNDVQDDVGFSRLQTPIGGATLFGNLLAPFPMVCYFLFEKKYSVPMMLVTLIAIYLTGTRTAMFIFMFLFLLNLVYSHSLKKKISLLFFVLIVVLLILGEGISLGRYSSLHSSRSLSQAGYLYVFYNSSLSDLFLGRGLGLYFPYNEWYALSHSGLYKYVDNLSSQTHLLVDPHSSYIWGLLELGLVGFSILFIPLLTKLKKAYTIYTTSTYDPVLKSTSTYFLASLIIFMTESLVFNNPYIAFVFWFFIFLFIEKIKIKKL